MKKNIVLIGVFLLIVWAVVAVGSNGRVSPLASVASALNDISRAIRASEPNEPQVEEKEWYHGHFEINPSQNDAIFVVPVGRQFVLRRLYAMPNWKLSTNWYLAADDTSILDGSVNLTGTGPGGHTYKFQHDFPDNCLTVDANETFNTVNNDSSSLEVTVIGYFKNMP